MLLPISQVIKLNLHFHSFSRYAYPRDAPIRHPADVRKRPATLLFCVLHLRNSRGPALGGYSPAAMRAGAAT